ncbi:MAG: Zn-dependent hydrolase, partial [Bacteroidota bacterium]|nr:Zn-dependent hydrolase [Bacteroidota bacterium]
MIKKIINGVILSLFAFSVLNCGNKQNQKTSQNDSIVKYDSVMKEKLNQFAIFKLTTDFSKLTRKEKQMLPILIDVAKIMDEIFWEETLGDKEEFLKTIKDDYARKFALINYGPWERLNGDKPFIPSYGEKPAGANFYPKDMKKEEFQKLDSIERKNPYSVIRRKKDGTLESLAYHIVFHDKIKRAAYLLKKAAEFAEDKGLKNYLNMRADALMDDKYQKSDFAWMDMKDNTIDFVVGPIENYEDKLFGVKTAHEAFVLVKDKEWTKKLTKFISILPELQKGLPVDQKYKNEVPASGSDLGVYDVLYYAGDCNAASKTIAINLPNDEEVQLKKGARRIQLK